MTTSQEVLSRLQSLSPGQLPSDIFHAVAAITVTPIYEVVPVRWNGQEVEVLLLQREASDPVWGGLWHTPGTVIRANDVEGSFLSAQERIRAELGGATFRHEPTFVRMQFHQVRRGRELALIHWVELDGQPTQGHWVFAKALPETVVDTQRDFIAAAVENFRQQSRT